MAVSLTFQGQPLLFDAGNQAKSFMDKYQPIDDLLPYIADSIFRQDGKEGPVGQSHVGLASPNYPQPPRPRLNELYWPTGAARWARGFFLVSKTVRDAIKEYRPDPSASYSPSGFLEYSDTDRGVTNKFWMIALSTIPVSCADGESLWILPLVDARYFWQFHHLDDISKYSFTSWQLLFDYLYTQLSSDCGIKVDDIDECYGYPDTDEIIRKFRNIPQMLDAAAHSVGCRFVLHPYRESRSGYVHIMNWKTAEEEHKKNLTNSARYAGKDQDWYQIAGGDYKDGCSVPAYVEVVFPTYIHKMRHRYGRVYSIRVRSDGTIVTYKTTDPPVPIPTPQTFDPVDTRFVYTDLTKVFHTTYWADFANEVVTDSHEPAPTNEAACQALALTIANDYYRSATVAHDYTFVGIKDWMITGYDDHVTYYLGCEEEGRSLATTDATPIPDHMVGNYPKIIGMHDLRFLTRVQSSPLNFGIEDMLQQHLYIGNDVIFRPLGLDRIIAKTGPSGIPGRVGDQLYKADCEVYYIDDTDKLQVYVDQFGNNETHTIYNLNPDAVPGNVYIKIGKELLSGRQIYSCACLTASSSSSSSLPSSSSIPSSSSTPPSSSSQPPSSSSIPPSSSQPSSSSLVPSSSSLVPSSSQPPSSSLVPSSSSLPPSSSQPPSSSLVPSSSSISIPSASSSSISSSSSSSTSSSSQSSSSSTSLSSSAQSVSSSSGSGSGSLMLSSASEDVCACGTCTFVWIVGEGGGFWYLLLQACIGACDCISQPSRDGAYPNESVTICCEPYVG